MDSTTLKLRRTGTILKICILALGLHTMLLYADDTSEDNVEIQKTEQDSTDSTQKSIKSQEKSKSTNKQGSGGQATTNSKPKIENKTIKETWFINCSMNDVQIIITDTKNKPHGLSLPANGRPHKYKHISESLKKVVCREKTTSHKLDRSTITLNQSDLNTYEVFVFNCDQKVEKYKYKSIKEKNIALKYARMTKNEKLFQEISDQPIYNP